MLACAAAMLVLALPAMSGSIGCKNPSGESVDWWVILKIPKLSPSTHPPGSNGLQYVYMDPKNMESLDDNAVFTIQEEDIGSTGSALMRTLSPLNSAVAIRESVGLNTSSGELGYMLYNDEYPTGKVIYNQGHCKGVVLFDAESAMWLVHSVPKFPASGNVEYPTSGVTYGQSFLCMSLSLDQMDVASQYYHWVEDPSVYDSHIPSSLASKLPHLAAVANGDVKPSSEPKSTSGVKITTLGGATFSLFAKNAAWTKDLYDTIVAPTLQADLVVESWMRPRLASCCTPQCEYDAMNVQTMQLGDLNFKETEDHSKWVITKLASKGFVCEGGMNRQTSQWKRGGGTVCLHQPKLWTLFKKAITAIEEC